MQDPEAFEQVRAFALAGKPHVAGDGQVRKQTVVLRQVADAASLGAQPNAALCVEPDLAAESDAPLARTLQPGDGAQQRGLARAGRPDEHDRLRRDLQLGAEIESSPREGDVDFEEVHRRGSSLAVSRIAALIAISSTPIAMAWSRFASNSP